MNIGKIELHSDENGLVTLQCDKCKSRFKVEISYLEDDLINDIYCSICGFKNSIDTFYPEEVVQEVNKLAIAKFNGMINDSFKKFNSKYMKVGVNTIEDSDANLNFKDVDYDMQCVEVHCCEKKIALKYFDVIAGFYCPYCGRIIK